MTPCRTCPHRPRNAKRIYYDRDDLPMRGDQVNERLGGAPHVCHQTLDPEGCETVDSTPCVGQRAA